MPKPKHEITCPKCKGEGRLKDYGHVAGGRCYECRGRGTVTAVSQSAITAAMGQARASAHDALGLLSAGLRPDIVAVCARRVADELRLVGTVHARTILDEIVSGRHLAADGAGWSVCPRPASLAFARSVCEAGR